MKAEVIRKKFIEFFKNHNHEEVSSSSLVPHNDPTLLFTNAGMNQFKDFFIGQAVPPYTRAVSAQKCVRAGGKHNDLDEVGKTARHHTFFEMLGNFSFGDYFKKEAIEFAWEFLTHELKIDPEKLIVSVFEKDDEAFELWRDHMKIPQERIIRMGAKDNFWEMGSTGPCGPCSEIYYDFGGEYSSGPLEDGENILADEGRYVEIWNLVFMQYEKDQNGKLHDLPKPCIDTGAGLERLAAVLQEKYWNYDTDLFTPITSALSQLTKKTIDEENVTAFRVVADHLRSSVMLMTDGVMPSNEGRGYVLRRIIRRAIRHLRDLGIQKGQNVLSQLVESCAQVLSESYPQNFAHQELAKKFLSLEEEKFLTTLDQGIRFFEDAIAKLSKNQKLFPGDQAFVLYDTYGLPIDLTEILLQERGMSLDQDGFSKAKKEQQERSRKARKDEVYEGVEKQWQKLKEQFGKTPFSYDVLDHEAKLLHVEPMGEGLFGLVFDQTSFYPEGGGQCGDVGVIQLGAKEVAEVVDTKRPVEEGVIVHKCIVKGNLIPGETYLASVDRSKRRLTTFHHSATHLLQKALIDELGGHVKQAGSSVGPSRLRFDFTHPQAMSREEVESVEDRVNQAIQNNFDVNAEVLSQEAALKKGALAFFGDKYGSKVRVVDMGGYSVEFCGGTHVKQTGDIGQFCILSESALASGVRRIEAVVSSVASSYLRERSKKLKVIERELGTNAQKVLQQVQGIKEQVKRLEKERDELQLKIQQKESADLFSHPDKVGQTPFLFAKVAPGTNLKAMSDDFVSKHKGVLLLVTEANEEQQFQILLRKHKELNNFHCSKLFKEFITILGGRGGGREDMAQGQGNQPGKLAEFVDLIKEKLV